MGKRKDQISQESGLLKHIENAIKYKDFRLVLRK